MISVHVEVLPHLHRTIDAIKRARREGRRRAESGDAGRARSRRSPAIVDFVLVMSVNPGFGGQAFIPRSESKVRGDAGAARSRPGNRARPSRSTAASISRRAPRVVAAGARILVAGSAIFQLRRSRTRHARAEGGRAKPRSRIVTGGPLTTPCSTSRRARALRRNRSDGRRLLRELLRVVRGRTHRSAARRGLELSRDGSRGLLAAGRSKRTAHTVSRRDTTMSSSVRTTGRTAVAGADASSAYESRAPGRRHAARRRTHQFTRCSIATGRPCRLPERVRTRTACVDMKALVTGAAGFIGSTLAERLCRRRRGRRRHRLLHRLLPARDQGTQPRRAQARRRRSGLSSRAIQDADLPALLADRTHVFHLAAQAGVRKSWGRDFAVYTVNNIEATQVLPRGVYRRCRCSSGWSTRRARLCMATTSPLPMREDAAAAVRYRRTV